jgi:hypothetical protein
MESKQSSNKSMSREELKEMLNRLKEKSYYEHEDQIASRSR